MLGMPLDVSLQLGDEVECWGGIIHTVGYEILILYVLASDSASVRGHL